MPRHVGHGIECQAAHGAGVERNHVRDVFTRMNGVKADNLAGKVKSQHLFLAFMVDNITLEATGAHRGHRAELIAGPEQVLAGLNGTGTMHDLLETFGFVWREAPWQAQLSERTSAARDL
jgi:hypothetical protein